MRLIKKINEEKEIPEEIKNFLKYQILETKESVKSSLKQNEENVKRIQGTRYLCKKTLKEIRKSEKDLKKIQSTPENAEKLAELWQKVAKTRKNARNNLKEVETLMEEIKAENKEIRVLELKYVKQVKKALLETFGIEIRKPARKARRKRNLQKHAEKFYNHMFKF